MIGKVLGLGAELIGQGGIIDQYVEDKDLAAKIKEKIAERDAALQSTIVEADAKIASGVQGVMIAEQERDKVAPRNWWQAGARPFILWVIGGGFAYAGVVGPILEQVAGWPMADVDSTALFAAATGAVGLGGVRGWEKIRGKAR